MLVGDTALVVPQSTYAHEQPQKKNAWMHKIGKFEEDDIGKTHHASSNIVYGFLCIHPWPIVEHVANARSAVHKSQVIFTSFKDRTKTETNIDIILNGGVWYVHECVYTCNSYGNFHTTKYTVIVIVKPEVGRNSFYKHF